MPYLPVNRQPVQMIWGSSYVPVPDGAGVANHCIISLPIAYFIDLMEVILTFVNLVWYQTMRDINKFILAYGGQINCFEQKVAKEFLPIKLQWSCGGWSVGLLGEVEHHPVLQSLSPTAFDLRVLYHFQELSSALH